MCAPHNTHIHPANAEKLEKREGNNPREKLRNQNSCSYLLSGYWANSLLPVYSFRGHHTVISSVHSDNAGTSFKQYSSFDKPHVPHSSLCTSLYLCQTLYCLEKRYILKKHNFIPLWDLLGMFKSGYNCYDSCWS